MHVSVSSGKGGFLSIKRFNHKDFLCFKVHLHYLPNPGSKENIFTLCDLRRKRNLPDPTSSVYHLKHIFGAKDAIEFAAIHNLFPFNSNYHFDVLP